MPNVNEMLVSKYLRKEDVEDADLLVTIKSVALEEMPGDDHQERWVLAFRELEKGLVLNATTIKVLAKAFGKHTDQWANNKVVLYVDPNVSFKGQVVGGLRVRPQKSKVATAVYAALAAQEAQPDFDDEIPMQ